MRLRDMSGADTSAAKVARGMQRLQAERDALEAEVERRKAIHLEDTCKLIDAGVDRAALQVRVGELEQALDDAIGWIEPSLGGRTAANRARRALHPDQQE